MKLKKHPILTELQVNENGTLILYKGQEITVRQYQAKKDNYPQKLVNFRGRTHRVTKLICETWHGMREHIDQVVRRRDLNPDNDHYTNLYWGKRGNQISPKKKRSSLSKLTEKDIETIIEELEKGVQQRVLAKRYGVGEMSIYRVKKRYLNDAKMVFREAVLKATDNYDRRFAFAKYLGFKSITEAVAKYGKNQFIQMHQQFTF